MSNGHHSEQKIRHDLTDPTPLTSGYEPIPLVSFAQCPRELPLFTFETIRAMLWDPTIRLGLAMRAAPICAAEFAYKEGEKWVPGIKADSPAVKEFVEQQLERIWRLMLPRLLKAQIWGWSAGEVVWRYDNKRKWIEIDRIETRHAMDCRAVVKDGQLYRVKFLRIKGQSAVEIRPPKALWHAHNADSGSYYGWPILIGCYSPWADKWFEGQAIDVRRLYMHKDAYAGVDIGYPPGMFEIPTSGGQSRSVPARDIARQIAEQGRTGNVTTHPNVYDHQGNPLWTVTRATAGPNATHILEYPKALDNEILRGMECPDDVLSSESGGAWQGKQVPQGAFYNGLNIWANDLLGDIVRQLIEPAVMLNFRQAVEFEAKLKPLAIQAAESSGAKPEANEGGGSPRQANPFGQQGGDEEPWPNSPQQMSLDQVAGNAHAIVLGVREAMQRMDLSGGKKDEGKKIAPEVLADYPDLAAARMALDANATEPAEPAHEFSSTQINLPPDVADKVRAVGFKIPYEELAEDGREDEPHVTVKFGLHTNDINDVRAVVESEPPILIRIGPLSIFRSDTHDVVKAEIESDDLHRINAKIAAALPTTDSHPDYQPHLTLAYVKPGMGEKYVGLTDLDGIQVVANALIFSDKNRNHTEIELRGEAAIADPLDFPDRPEGEAIDDEPDAGPVFDLDARQYVA